MNIKQYLIQNETNAAIEKALLYVDDQSFSTIIADIINFKRRKEARRNYCCHQQTSVVILKLMLLLNKVSFYCKLTHPLLEFQEKLQNKSINFYMASVIESLLK